MPRFTEKDKQLFTASPHVIKVTDSHVHFKAEFKLKAIKLHANGLPPSEVFLKLGIDPRLFAENYPKKTIYRWEQIFEAEGEEGLRNEKRGKSSKGRPKKSTKSPQGEAALFERIAYLEEEVEFLKKLRALEEQYAKKKNTR